MKNNIFDNNLSEKFFIEGLDFFSKSDYKKAKENFKISVINNPNNIKSLYHFLVLLEFKKISITSIMKELKRRQKISGIQEKKSRNKNVR